MHECDESNSTVTHSGESDIRRLINLQDDGLYVHDSMCLLYNSEIDMPSLMHGRNDSMNDILQYVNCNMYRRHENSNNVYRNDEYLINVLSNGGEISDYEMNAIMVTHGTEKMNPTSTRPHK